MRKLISRLAGCLSVLSLTAGIGVPAAAGEPAVKVFELRIEGGKVAENMRLIRIDHDDSVVLRWTSNQPIDLHLHGYEIEIKVVPGTVAEIAFKAFATGRYPILVHVDGKDAHDAPLVSIEIYPR